MLTFYNSSGKKWDQDPFLSGQLLLVAAFPLVKWFNMKKIHRKDQLFLPEKQVNGELLYGFFINLGDV